MVHHSDSGSMTGDVAFDVDCPEGALSTLGENTLARRAAGASKASGKRPVRGDVTRFNLDRPRAVETKRLSFAAGKNAYVAKVAGETLRQLGSTSRPDGRLLPKGPDIYVVSTEGHRRQVAKGNFRPELQLYLFEKRVHFDTPAVFLRTWLDGEDVVFDLSVPCRGILEALMLGRVNHQMAIYHPASKECLQVPDSKELSRIAAACSYAQRRSLPDALACVAASLSDLPQDVHVAVLGLINTIMSVHPDDVTEQTLEQLQRICRRASEFDGNYVSWFAVALAHAVHQREAASSAVPLGQGVLQAAV